MAYTVMINSELVDLQLLKRGKTRDIYELEDKLLIVASDRISCFDVVLPTPIPEKGRVLTAISVFWFHYTQNIIDNHLLAFTADRFPEGIVKHNDLLKGRALLVKKAKVVPFECIVRGYLTGSGLKEYLSTRSICGIKLPPGLLESSKLPEPIFTPSTKAESGHDQNVTQRYMENALGRDLSVKLKETSISLYERANEYAESRGLIIADTKFEFGMIDGKLILIDELLTPDSSRFWPLLDYEPGKKQASFDKQFVRDYLENLDWDKTDPGPMLPETIVAKTTEKYLQALQLITGRSC